MMLKGRRLSGPSSAAGDRWRYRGQAGVPYRACVVARRRMIIAPWDLVSDLLEVLEFLGSLSVPGLRRCRCRVRGLRLCVSSCWRV